MANKSECVQKLFRGWVPDSAVWRNTSHPWVSLVPTVFCCSNTSLWPELAHSMVRDLQTPNHLLSGGDTAHGSTPAEPKGARLHEMQWSYGSSEKTAVQGCWWGIKKEVLKPGETNCKSLGPKFPGLLLIFFSYFLHGIKWFHFATLCEI